MNRDVIAVDQDKLGKAGRRVAKSGETEVWARPLDHGEIAVALFNRGETEQEVSVNWADAGAPANPKVRDLWAHADVGRKSGKFSASVAPHGVVMIKLSK